MSFGLSLLHEKMESFMNSSTSSKITCEMGGGCYIKERDTIEQFS